MFKKLFGFGKKKEETKVEEVVSDVEKEEVKEDDERFLENLESEKENTKDEAKADEVVVEEEIAVETKSEEESDECEEVNVVLDEEGVSIFEETVAEVEEKVAEEEAVEDLIDVVEEIESIEEASDAIVETQVLEEANEGREKPAAKKEGLFARLKRGLTKAKQGITDRIDEVLKSYTSVDDELFEDLEEVLITADVGVNTTMQIIDDLNDRVRSKKITDPMAVREELKEIVEEILSKGNSKLDVEPSPAIIIMVGVNGVGKTTTIGKLALRYKSEGKKVMLAAADTFRAAATEQLDIWAKRTNTEIVKHHEGADPGAVVFDAIKAAKARKTDVLICDTAGRLHNKANLMNELGKIFKIIDKEFPEAKKEVLLVVDATTGQNAVVQAKSFKEVADITGIVLTKLDGTAKGGVVLAVKSEVDVPVKLIGVGEKAEDLQDFDAREFTAALFGN
ncbi:signal recognition particle-docking protein FtsY [Peptacetobacter hiranonis]|uniref:signal recognition particle-docking protein FtsY n=1 Tax=Peptacetobacter hiranonis TaxID=89152 RepID=UPI0022E2740F|nr:signal recognition particle-docking protein FtsY [Peptacetobacter hiranonis]